VANGRKWGHRASGDLCISPGEIYISPDGIHKSEKKIYVSLEEIHKWKREICISLGDLPISERDLGSANTESASPTPKTRTKRASG